MKAKVSISKTGYGAHAHHEKRKCKRDTIKHLYQVDAQTTELKISVLFPPNICV